MRTCVAFLLNLTFLSVTNGLLAQGTAFTYQGRLNAGGNPASGSYDLTFTLFNANTGGGAIGGPLTNLATAVSNGLFTTAVDFGPGRVHRQRRLAGDRRADEWREQVHHPGAAPATDAGALCDQGGRRCLACHPFGHGAHSRWCLHDGGQSGWRGRCHPHDRDVSAFYMDVNLVS